MRNPLKIVDGKLLIACHECGYLVDPKSTFETQPLEAGGKSKVYCGSCYEFARAGFSAKGWYEACRTIKAEDDKKRGGRHAPA